MYNHSDKLDLLEALITNNDNFIQNNPLSLSLHRILQSTSNLHNFYHWFDCIMDFFTSPFNTSSPLITFEYYINSLSFLKTDPQSSSTFMFYCSQILHHMNSSLTSNNRIHNQCELFFQRNKISSLCFITPELGRFSTIGGLGVMVDELTQSLNEYGYDITIISPYYHYNRKGVKGYLESDSMNIKQTQILTITLDKEYTVDVWYGKENNINYYFIHNEIIFPKPYAEGTAAFIVSQISLFAKACLTLIMQLQMKFDIVLTNDWFTGFVPGYAKSNEMKNYFNDMKFFHICHNLQESYEGRIYPSHTEGNLQHIHHLPIEYLIDPYWNDKCINPSRCAIMNSDQWGTVSYSYKQELLSHSSLNHLLRKHYHPFGTPNGVIKSKRLQILNEVTHMDRTASIAYIQKTYFDYNEPNLHIPIFSFVGRITEQKGVALILDIVEDLIMQTDHKVNILVGGMGNPNDPYAIECKNKMNYLKSKYPHCFWGNPDEFFTDGPHINLGSSFGLMPSKFEPGGIVQHEFFVAGTPVLAFRTGGLKDTVFEFEFKSQSGNGVVFDKFCKDDLLSAMLRAIDIFANKDMYNKCRINAFNSVIDVKEDVAKEWSKEFYRLKGLLYYEREIIKEERKDKEKDITCRKGSCNEWRSDVRFSVLDKVKAYKNGNGKLYMLTSKDIETNNIDNDDVGYEHNKVNTVTITTTTNTKQKYFSFNWKDHKYVNEPTSIQICGSFDNWKIRHPLTKHKHIANTWYVILNIPRGVYKYKYIVDGDWIINTKEEILIEGNGVANNSITVKL